MQLPYRKPGKYSQIPTDTLMTQAKFNELKEKLERLKTSQPQAARDVARLAEMGDFSENVEYQLAKGRLRAINENILRLEYTLEHAEIIQTKNSDTVQIGSTVQVESEKGTSRYQILGSSESNPGKGIISHRSPLGTGLLGHRVQEKVKIVLGGKEIEYTIVNIL